MATIFTPPTAPLRPAAVNPSHPGFALFRHYRPWDAGTNVWLLEDGTVTTVEPDPNTVDIARVFHGGHLHEVDDDEAALLTAAGYEDNLTEVSTSTPSGLPSLDMPEWDTDLPDALGF